MPTITVTQKELNVFQDILKRLSGGNETPAVKSTKKKLTAEDRLNKKYGKI